MKKSITTTALFAVLTIVLSASIVKADMLSGEIVLNKTSSIVNNGSSQNIYVTPMLVDNHTTGQTLLAFCGDFTVNTSSAFGSSTGQAYNASSLFSPTLTIYSDLQKSRINDLFSYTYALGFDLDGTVISSTYAQSLQLAVWEILTETANTLNILKDSFYGANLTSAVSTATNSWLSAISGQVTWDSLGLSATEYDMTVYVANGGKNVSQTLISITAPSTAPSTTPEPASLAIFAVGAAAAFPFLRRRKVAMA